MTYISTRVFRRWLQKLADQAPGQRKRVRDLTKPINPPKGLDKDLRREQGMTMAEGEDNIKPDRKDIAVKDIYSPNRNSQGVQNLVETGQGFTQKQVQKDKGFENVKNLSQYLIRTEGGSGDGPEGKNL